MPHTEDTKEVMTAFPSLDTFDSDEITDFTIFSTFLCSVIAVLTRITPAFFAAVLLSVTVIGPGKVGKSN